MIANMTKLGTSYANCIDTVHPGSNRPPPLWVAQIVHSVCCFRQHAPRARTSSCGAVFSVSPSLRRSDRKTSLICLASRGQPRRGMDEITVLCRPRSCTNIVVALLCVVRPDQVACTSWCGCTALLQHVAPSVRGFIDGVDGNVPYIIAKYITCENKLRTPPRI